jgi:hypothetical protein
MQAKYQRFNKTALVVRRIISTKGIVASIEVDIKSSLLNDVLLDINEDVEGLSLNKTPPMVRSPVHSAVDYHDNLSRLLHKNCFIRYLA